MNELPSKEGKNFRVPVRLVSGVVEIPISGRQDGLVRARDVEPDTPVEVRYRNREGYSPVVVIRGIRPTKQPGNPQILTDGIILGGGTFVMPLRKLS